MGWRGLQKIPGDISGLPSQASLRMAREVAEQLEVGGMEEDPDRPFTLRMEGGDFTRNECRIVMTIPVRRKP